VDSSLPFVSDFSTNTVGLLVDATSSKSIDATIDPRILHMLMVQKVVKPRDQMLSVALLWNSIV
jgi:hypothetical protein